jgi:hypothetical protein
VKGITSARLDAATRVGTHLVGFYFDEGGRGTVMVDFSATSTEAKQTYDSPQHAVSVGEGMCGVYAKSSTGNDQVRCYDFDRLGDADDPGTVLLDTVAHAAIDADDQYLYVAYQCLGALTTLHVTRILHAQVAANGVQSACAP